MPVAVQHSTIHYSTVRYSIDSYFTGKIPGSCSGAGGLGREACGSIYVQLMSRLLFRLRRFLVLTRKSGMLLHVSLRLPADLVSSVRPCSLTAFKIAFNKPLPCEGRRFQEPNLSFLLSLLFS